MAEKRPYDTVKRGLDVVASAGALIVLSPVMAGVALAVRKNLGSPVVFKQPRPGKDGKVFTLYKFRSMKDKDESVGLIEDENRLTPFGEKLRSTSLDELPSLLNVLRGEMSFVGPRPLLVEYLDLYTPEQARRHNIRPGITGLAQVSGRNEVEWEEKFSLDTQYVESRSLMLDAQIVLRTVKTVFVKDGISNEGHATMTKFEGTS